MEKKGLEKIIGSLLMVLMLPGAVAALDFNGFVNNSSGSPLSGITVSHNGRYFIFNVANDDTVTVSASKAGWAFSPVTFHTHSGSLNVSGGNIFGTSHPLYLPLILKGL